MENYKQTKKVERTIVGCMLFLVALVGVAIFSFIHLGKVRRENAAYDNLIASLKQEQAMLSSDISHVSSYEFLDDAARNELGMIKDGETLYVFK